MGMRWNCCAGLVGAVAPVRAEPQIPSLFLVDLSVAASVFLCGLEEAHGQW